MHDAVRRILASKTFDYGTICASEQSVICETCNRDAVMAEFRAQGGYFMTEEECKKVCALLFRNGHSMSPKFEGHSPQSLAQAAALSFADSPFSEISDGQRPRILMARALCQPPQLIELDEPTSYLDIRYKLELLSVLKRMVRENDLAVLLSLHELDLARRISDTIVCVAGDRIDRIGPPEEIFTSDYIAQLYHLERGKYDPCFSTLEFVPLKLMGGRSCGRQRRGCS